VETSWWYCCHVLNATPRVFTPSVVAQFVTETPRSAWEVHQFLNEISQADGATVEAEDVADLKKWLLTVGRGTRSRSRGTGARDGTGGNHGTGV
jgi:hypothetical protein